MINLNLFTDGTWEQVRGYLRDDLERIQAEFNNHVDQTTSLDGSLPAEVIQGDASHGRRYVANTGVDPVTGGPAPKWDVVLLDGSGIAGRLPFDHIATLDPGFLIGRRNSGSAGDLEPITVGSGLVMTGATLSASGSSLTNAQVAARVAGRF